MTAALEASAAGYPVHLVEKTAALGGWVAKLLRLPHVTGNILGGVAGAKLGIDVSPHLLTLASGLIAGLLLWFGAPRTVARLLSLLVAVMGVAFLVTAWKLRPDVGELLSGAFVPRLPAGSALLVLGLVGTTVVPYNLFLGSGLARGQTLGEMRFGLTVAVLLGGLISMGVVVVGAAVDGPLGFEALADVLQSRLGGWAKSLFAAGLFAAGLSSAITAPLAAAITTRSLFARRGTEREPSWTNRSRRFRAVWIAVLAVGVGFGLAGLRPIPAILLAQALNGVLLPLVAVFLLLTVNDRRLMGDGGVNGAPANLLLAAVVASTVVLGVTNLAKAIAGALGLPVPGERPLLLAAAALTVLGLFPIWRGVRRLRGQANDFM
jgi:Mn2+/Fe2+ NRAMP family transporter